MDKNALLPFGLTTVSLAPMQEYKRKNGMHDDSENTGNKHLKGFLMKKINYYWKELTTLLKFLRN